MRIATKLKLGTVTVLGLLVLYVITTFYLHERMMKETEQLAMVEEPLEEALVEMEINAGETARAVLRYLREHQERDVDEMRRSGHDFERYQK